jgi:hypothetical protein
MRKKGKSLQLELQTCFPNPGRNEKADLSGGRQANRYPFHAGRIALFAKTVLFQHPASVRSRPGRK